MDLKRYLENEEDFIYAFKIKGHNNKIRTIITYKCDSNGTLLRNKHKNLLEKIDDIPSYKYSYAYKKGKSTKDAFSNHHKSKLFIKLDIHQFFESITSEYFHNVCGELLNEYNIKDELDYCFYKDHLILGFVTSPKMSDIYLYQFDLKIDNYLKKHKRLNYSRYSDDILISSRDKDFGRLRQFSSYIRNELAKLNLEINEEKIKEYDLNKVTSVSFLGLNYSYSFFKSKITLSKRYILKAFDYYNEYEKIVNKREKLIQEKDALVKEHLKNKEEGIKDPTYKSNIVEKYKNIKELTYKAKFMFNNANSMVSYIRFNSSVTYEKFLKKFENKYGKEWSGKYSDSLSK